MTAPFPWFGGKRRAAPLVWPRFGDVANYVEPFAGSLAIMLARPHAAKVETVNDRDAYLANFWRAVQADPEAVERFTDYPVSEADLHARHVWLLAQTDFRERMLTDPEYFDPKIAGWWVWGISSWIGSGWCDYERTNERTNEATVRPTRKIPELGSERGIRADRFQNSPASAASMPQAAAPHQSAGSLHARTHARTVPTTARPFQSRPRRHHRAKGVSLTPSPNDSGTCALPAVIGAAS